YLFLCTDSVSPLQDTIGGKALAGVSRAPGTHRGVRPLVRLYLRAHPPGPAGILALVRQGEVLATAFRVVRSGFSRGFFSLDHYQCAESICRARDPGQERVGALRTRVPVGRLGPS